MSHLYSAWEHRRMVLGCLVATLALTTAWTTTRPERYRAEALINVSPVLHPLDTRLDVTMGGSQADRFINDQLMIFRTRELAQRVVDRLGLANHPAFGDEAADEMLDRISVERADGSFDIRISLTAEDPDSLREWLDAYVEEFIASDIEWNFQRERQVHEVVQRIMDSLSNENEQSDLGSGRIRAPKASFPLSGEGSDSIKDQIVGQSQQHGRNNRDFSADGRFLDYLKTLQREADSSSTTAASTVRIVQPARLIDTPERPIRWHIMTLATIVVVLIFSALALLARQRE